MLSIILGYLTPKRTGAVVTLYAGDQGDKARELLTNPPPGILYTELLVNPQRAKGRVHDGEGRGYVAVLDAVAAEAAAERIPLTIEDLPEELREEIDAAMKAKEELAGIVAEKDAALTEVTRLSGELAAHVTLLETERNSNTELSNLIGELRKELEGLREAARQPVVETTGDAQQELPATVAEDVDLPAEKTEDAKPPKGGKK